ncbi:NADPH:quinone reductase [uncultured Jatrophihabitans sp.]|uniref:NADPH:quinone reductase n=1 Tax=uncultured Jatrophihabitans sp. TaxID=1610747 RepID=UPI0035CBE916
MRAAWFDRRGPARDVLVVGELPDPAPGPGEVRIAVEVSGLSPGDVKKRSNWQGSEMAFPRVIPHSDGAGVIDAVGADVPESRIGTRVWCYGAQSYRPFGTAAEYVVVPTDLAVDLPHSPDQDDRWLSEQAACLGIAGITGYRSVFADGPVTGLHVLIHGAVGGVGAIATQMARRDGATVIAVVREGQDERARALGASHVLDSARPDLAEAVRALAPNGVNRIADVDFAANVEVNSQVVAIGATIASFATSVDRPAIPYWTLGFADTCLRLLGSDDFAPEVKAHAAAELTAALVEGALRSVIVERFPLEHIAAAQEAVEAGAPGRVLVQIT